MDKLFAPCVTFESTEQDYKVGITLMYTTEEPEKQESLQEAKQHYDDTEAHYRKTVAKNKLLKDELFALKVAMSQQESIANESFSSLRRQFDLLQLRYDLLSKECKDKDSIIEDLKVRLPGPEKSHRLDAKVQVLNDELKKTLEKLRKCRNELTREKEDMEEVMALGKRRDEQIKLLLKKIKQTEAEAELFKDELKVKQAKLTEVERRLRERKTQVEQPKTEALGKKLKDALKTIEDKNSEIDLLKEMLKQSNGRHRDKDPEPTLQKVQRPRVYDRSNHSHELIQGRLPSVKMSLTPVPQLHSKKPYLDAWPRASHSRRPNPAAAFLTPKKQSRSLLPNMGYVHSYSPPLELIHNNIMNYTPSDLRLPPVELETPKQLFQETLKRESSIGSRSQGLEGEDGDLSPEDL